MRASVDAMPRDRLAEVDAETRARVATAGAEALNASLTPEQRAQNATNAANAAHRPANLARRIVKAWPELTRRERAEVREILREGGVILP